MERGQSTFLRVTASKKVVLLILVVAMVCPSLSAKRFDCRVFCKETGFHGMVGGCRCSFTLFTAKRDHRDLESDANSNKGLLVNPLMELLVRDRVDPKLMAQLSKPLSRDTLLDINDSRTLDFLRKRREQEQDLDNGETRDYLRLAY